MRVLIAEDDAALASFVRKGLEAEHYAVDVTADGEQARAMAGELDYDLLMLDLNLPRVLHGPCGPPIGMKIGSSRRVYDQTGVERQRSSSLWIKRGRSRV